MHFNIQYLICSSQSLGRHYIHDKGKNNAQEVYLLIKS